MNYQEILKNNPSNGDLCYIMCYCTDETLRNSAGEMLKGQSPSNDDLCYIMRHSPDETFRNSAWEMLKAAVAPGVEIDEEALIKEIAQQVLSHPGSLEMSEWHCGAAHCLAGWATVLNEDARKIEQEHDTHTAGCVALPSYAHLFFLSNEEALEVLKNL